MLNEYDELLAEKETTQGNEYVDMLADDKSVKKQSVQQSMFVAADKNPDMRAEVMKLSEKTQLPPNVVERNFDALSKKAKVQLTDYDDLIDNTPGLASWMENPDNAALAHDDLDSLKAQENALKERGFARELFDSIQVGGLKLAKGVVQAPALMAKAHPYEYAPMGVADDTASRLEIEEANKNFKPPEFLYKNPITESIDKRVEKLAPRELNVEVFEELKKGNFGTATKALTLQVASNLPQLGLIAITRGAGLGVMFSSSAGSKYADNLEKGIDPQVAKVNALATAGIETGIESIGGIGGPNPLTQAIKDIAGVVGKQGAKQIVKESVKNVVRVAGEEGAEEFATSIAQDLTDYSMGVNDKALDGMFSRAASSFLVGAGSGGIVATPQTVATAFEKFKEVHNADADKRSYLQMGEEALKSKLFKRSKDAHANFVADVVKNTKAENVYLSADALEAYFQTAPEGNLVELLNQTGSVEQFNRSKETGEDMKIPYSQWVKGTLGTAYYQGLADDVKFEPGAMSAREAKADLDAAKEELKQAKADAEAKDPATEAGKAVIENVAEQLKAIGQDPRQAALYRGFEVLARRTGQDPLELFNKYKLQIGTGEGLDFENDPVISMNQDGTPKKPEDITLDYRPNSVQLSAEQRAVETKLARALSDEGAFDKYSQLPDAQGGKYLDTDLARNLSPEYASGKEGAMLYTQSTHAPAGQFIWNAFLKKLTQEPAGAAVFMFGGGGAGKSSVIKGPLAEDPSVDFIYDGTGQRIEDQRDKIDRAIESGRPARNVFVYVPVQEAARRAYKRFKESGRTIPPRAFVEGHVKALDNFIKLAKEYQGVPGVYFEAFDNTDVLKPLSIEQLEALRYTIDGETLEQTVRRVGAEAERVMQNAEQEIQDLQRNVREERSLFQAVSRDDSGAGQASGTVSQTGRRVRQEAYARAIRPFTASLENLPASSPGHNQLIRDAAQAYLHTVGFKQVQPIEYVQVDPNRGAKIAEAFEAMPHDPENPEVKAAYNALIKETLDQFQVVKGMGLKIEAILPGMPNPYPNGSKDMFDDISRGHLWFFPTVLGFGTDQETGDHPLLQETNEEIDGKKLLANDVFRIVHDIFGHAKEGVAFGPNGEENAWQSHVRMYSPLAAKALTSETRGQNSWVNFGPFGEQNRSNKAETKFAQQKAGLLPDWVLQDGLSRDMDFEVARFFQTELPAVNRLTPIGFFSQVEAEIQKMDFKQIPAKDLANRIKNLQGIKKEELEALGLLDWLNAKEDKVTKEEVIEFVQQNGIQVEQIVKGNIDDVETEAVSWRDPVRDTYYDDDSIDNEVSYYLKEDKDTAEEIKQEALAKDPELEGRDLEEAMREIAYERARDVVERDDYYGARFTVTEESTGFSLEGSDELGWYAPETEKEYGYNLEEAKIRFIGDLIDRGDIEQDIKEFSKISDLEFRQPAAAIKPAKQTITKRKKQILKDKGDELRALAEKAANDSNIKAEEREQWIKEDIDWRVGQMAEDYYDDPNNQKNTVSVTLNHPVIEGRITGNNVNGWRLSVRNPDTNEYDKEIKLDAKQLDKAQEEVKKILVDKGYAKPEVVSTDDINKPTSKSKWGKYVVPNGENYREVLLTLPRIGPDKFQYTTHFNEENVVTHIRLTDRTDSKGRKTLFIEELQSDWHQQGRERGYRSDVKDVQDKIDALKKEDEELMPKQKELDKAGPAKEEEWKKVTQRRADIAGEINDLRDSISDVVPDAPFKQTDAWASLAMKRMFRMAAEMGYDAVAWTPSQVHVDRWGTDSISWSKTDEGWLVGSVEQRGGIADGVNIEEMARIRGELLSKSGELVKTKEELFKVISDTLNRERNDRSLGALTESVWKQMQIEPSGGKKPRQEGMEFFYDNVIPRKVVPAVLKKLDKNAKVEVTEFDTDGDTLKALTVPLTDDIKNKVLAEGQALFQGKKDNPLGMISFSKDRNFRIDLLENANRSTFIHETGHFYVEVLGDLAEQIQAIAPDIRTAEQKQIVDDYNTLLKFVGVESRADVKTEQHEKLARAFEAYIFEGKAPSTKLRKVFAKFRSWLVQVYRNITGLNVQLTDEVRGVMDRILATDEEIREVNRKQNTAPLFDDAIVKSMPKDMAERYVQALEEARLATEEELATKLLKEEQRKEQKAYIDRERKVRKEVTEQVEASPIFRAIDQMRSGNQLPDGTDFKLNKADLIRDFGKEIIQKLPRGVTSDNGLHHSIVAEGLGFESGDLFVQQLANQPEKQDLINQIVQQKMDEIYPPISKPGPERNEAAIKAMLSENRAKVLKMELEYLAANNMAALKDGIKRITKKPPTDKAVREQAEVIVGNEKVQDIKPYIYQRAEAKSAKEAGEFFVKGDMDKAFESKRKQLLSLELYRSSNEAKEKIEKALENLKKVYKKTEEDLSKSRDVDLVNAARAVLSLYGLGKSDKTPEALLDPIRQYDPETYATIKALVDAATEKVAPYNELTFNEFMGMHDAVMAIWDLAKSSREIEIDGQKRNRDEVIEELGVRLGEVSSGSVRAGYQSYVSDWDKAKLYLMGMKAALRRVESWVDAIDGEGKEFRRYLWNPISESIGRYRLAKKDTLAKYLDIVKGIEKTLTFKEIMATELNYRFKDKAQLLGALLHTGNKSNLSKLLRGYGWGMVDEAGNLDTSRWDAFIARMINEGVITKTDYDFVQAVWDLNESLKPQAQKAHKQMYGFYFSEITADEVRTPFGSYRGGYVPAVTDPFVVTDQAVREQREEIEKSNNSFMFPTSGRGFTKSRVDKYAAPLEMNIGLIPRHLDKVLRFIHIEPHVKDVGKIVFNKKFQTDLDSVDQTVRGDMLVPWLQRSAQQKISSSTDGWGGRAIDTFFREVRTRTGLNIMVGNVLNTFQQLTGLSIAAVKVKPKYLRNALSTYIRAPKKVADEIADKSEFMDSRLKNQSQETLNHIDEILLNPTKYDKARDFAQKHGYFLQSAFQNIVDVITWSGAYDQAVEEGKTEKEAVREADSAVRLTQGSFNAEDISRFETGTPFMRAFTMFYSYFNMQANLLGTEFNKVARDMGLRKGYGRALYVYTLGFMIPAVLSELIVKAGSGAGLDEDDDDNYLDDLLSVFFSSQFRSGTAMFPVVGPTVAAGVNMFNDKWYDDRISTSPTVSVLESVAKTPYSVWTAMKGEGSKKRAVKDSLTTVGLLTGLPVAPLGRPLGYLIDVQEGKANPTGPVDFTRGLVTGKSEGK